MSVCLCLCMGGVLSEVCTCQLYWCCRLGYNSGVEHVSGYYSGYLQICINEHVKQKREASKFCSEPRVDIGADFPGSNPSWSGVMILSG